MLVAVRLALLALLVFCLIRPSLILHAAVPQQNFLGVLIDDSRSMTIADRDEKPRTDFVHEQFGAGRPAGQSALAAVRPPLLPLLLVGRPHDQPDRPEIRGHGHPPGPGARARARRAVRSAARRPRDGDRRRRHVRRDARRAAGQPEGAVDPGLPRRRRPGSLRTRHPDHARRNATHDAQGHLARRRRRHLADRVRRLDGGAPGRRRRTDRQLAGRHACRRMASRRPCV